MSKEILNMELSSYEEGWKLDEEKNCWYLENVIYCQKPLAPHLQCLSLFIPRAYRNPEGSWNWETECNGFTAKTAPVIFENKIGGYAESISKKIDDIGESELAFLNVGMIYVSPGTRGKQSVDSEGCLIGKAPAGLIDLKAAVRFLKHNQSSFPGDTGHIISMGVSAGGAMSSLLGVTGNNENYLEYLEEIGAVMDETDNVFAAQCYCPIIDLEHADMAYEWMFRGIHHYKGKPSMGGGILELNDIQKAISEKLADRYAAYFNSLQLKNPENGETLLLGETGRNGTADAYLLKVIQNALDKHLSREGKNNSNVVDSIREFTCHLDDTYQISSFDDFIRCYLPRIKSCPAFDNLSNDSAENQVFGSFSHNFSHFDSVIQEILDELESEFGKECKELKAEFAGIKCDAELKRKIYLLNPLNYIDGNEDASMAPYFRIRVGTKDPHTSFTMAMILALKLAETGRTRVDYAMVWDEDHGKADYPGEFIRWAEEILR